MNRPMPPGVCWPIALAAIALGGCDAGTGGASGVAARTGATASLEDHLRTRYGDLVAELRYFTAATDLDGDGRPELVVHVAGPMTCGTGGCDTLVLTPEGDHYAEIARVAITRPPIRASRRRTNGWRNLLVQVGGGGLGAGYEAELFFDGRSYPVNPTVPPAAAATDTAGAETLIETYASYTEGRPVPPR